MEPVGQSDEIRRVTISGGNWARHRIGGCAASASNQVPPMPMPQASTVPRKAGSLSTNSPHLVGREEISFASHRRSSSWSCTAGVRSSR